MLSRGNMAARSTQGCRIMRPSFSYSSSSNAAPAASRNTISMLARQTFDFILLSPCRGLRRSIAIFAWHLFRLVHLEPGPSLQMQHHAKSSSREVYLGSSQLTTHITSHLHALVEYCLPSFTPSLSGSRSRDPIKYTILRAKAERLISSWSRAAHPPARGRSA